MKQFIKENWFRIVIVILLSIITLSYAFSQYAYYQKQQSQIQSDKEKKISLEECLVTAQENYELTWNDTCSNGIGDWINICQGEQGENCTQCILSDEQSNKLNLLLEKNKENCYKRFPIK